MNTDSDSSYLAGVPAVEVSGSGVPSLHAAIMNLAADKATLAKMDGSPKGFYLLGHRDARHAAAELAIARQPLLGELLSALESILEITQEEHFIRSADSKLYEIGTYTRLALRKAGAPHAE